MSGPSTQHPPVPRVVSIPSSTLRGYETGAILVSELVFPEHGADKQRHTIQQATCNVALRRASKDKAWADSEQAIRPAYAFLLDREVDQAMKVILRNLRHRQIAGLTAFTLTTQRLLFELSRQGAKDLVSPELEKIYADLPASLATITNARNNRQPQRGASINQLADLFSHLSGVPSETTNLKSRVLGPSRPVLHLAIVLMICSVKGKELQHPHILLSDIAFLENLANSFVEYAEVFTTFMHLVPQYRNIPAQLTKFTFT